MTRKLLKGRRLAIAAGHTDLPRRKVDAYRKLWASQGYALPARGVGDVVESALSSVGITKDRVSAIVGKDCGCSKRQDALNRLFAFGASPSRHPDFIATIQPAMRVSGRAVPTWDRTRASVLAAGFPEPLIFREPNAPECGGHLWPKQMGPIASFKAMCERLLTDTSAEWFLLLEDDVLLSDHTAAYLRTLTIKDDILSLYVAGPKQMPAAGWSVIRRPMVGSLALVVRRGALMRLMQSRQWRKWPKRDCVDQMVHRAAGDAGLSIRTHHPSLAQHIGEAAAIYQDRTLASPLRHAADWTQAGPWQPPTVTLITPTGDRPESFALCQRMMARQMWTGDVQWIVIDDGKRATDCTAGQTVIRLRPMHRHSLCRNLCAAIPRADGDVVLIIEDDDWYSPDYISAMVGRLSQADLAGETGAKYYYLRSRQWRHNWDRENHASLCRTGMRANVLPTLLRAATHTHHPSVDLRLWRLWEGSRHTWTDPDGVCNLCVGIKGVRGRPSPNWRPSRSARPDPDGQMLRRWVGADAEWYT